LIESISVVKSTPISDLWRKIISGSMEKKKLSSLNIFTGQIISENIKILYFSHVRINWGPKSLGNPLQSRARRAFLRISQSQKFT